MFQVTVVYGNNTNAGTATADATFAGDANHNSSNATQVTFTIDKASSSSTINCPTNVTYNGSPQTPCTATATGAGGLNVSVTVVYGNNTNAARLRLMRPLLVMLITTAVPRRRSRSPSTRPVRLPRLTVRRM
jgi:hypothetical protein